MKRQHLQCMSVVWVACMLLSALMSSCSSKNDSSPQSSETSKSSAPLSYEGPVRNVIVISLDTTRPDHFGCMGNPWLKTPHIDALASESILFKRSFTVVPGTLASHVTLFTGKHPHTHGTPYNGFVVNNKNEMLAEILQSRGFRTAGFIAAFPLHTRTNIQQGFDDWDESFPLVKEGGTGRRNAREVTDAVLSYLDRTSDTLRRFLFVHYFDPHSHYFAPPPYDQFYPREKILSEANGHGAYGCARPDGSAPTDEDYAQSLAYAGAISFMDEHVGRLIEGLRARGILDDSILALTSDHGEQFWEHEPFFDHGETVYESDIRIMTLFRLPKAAKGGTKIEGNISNLDVLPTLLHYLGVPFPDGIEGEEIELMAAETLEPRLVFSEANQPASTLDPEGEWYNAPNARCVIQGRHKFIRTPYKGNLEELYDIDADPCEKMNLLKEPLSEPLKTIADDLRHTLKLWDEAAMPLRSQFDPRHREESRKELEALGYFGGKSKGKANHVD